LDSERGQFLEGFAGQQVITRGFLRRKVEAGDRVFELEKGFQ
jgi:hypothetical protein